MGIVEFVVRSFGRTFAIALLTAALGCAAAPAPAPDAPEAPPDTGTREAAAPAESVAATPAYLAPRSFVDVPVEEALAQIAREGKVDIDYIGPDEGQRVTVRLPDGASWEEVLQGIADHAGLDVERRSTRLYAVRRGPRLTVDVVDVGIADIILYLAREAGTNVIVGEGVEGTVTLNLKDAPVREVLEAIAETGGYVLEREKTGWSLTRSGRP